MPLFPCLSLQNEKISYLEGPFFFYTELGGHNWLGIPVCQSNAYKVTPWWTLLNWNQSFITIFTRAHNFISWARWIIHAFPIILHSIFSIILPPRFRSYKQSFPFQFHHQCHMHFCSPPYVPHALPNQIDIYAKLCHIALTTSEGCLPFTASYHFHTV
jgi:hypothetical protein